MLPVTVFTVAISMAFVMLFYSSYTNQGQQQNKRTILDPDGNTINMNALKTTRDEEFTLANVYQPRDTDKQVMQQQQYGFLGTENEWQTSNPYGNPSPNVWDNASSSQGQHATSIIGQSIIGDNGMVRPEKLLPGEQFFEVDLTNEQKRNLESGIPQKIPLTLFYDLSYEGNDQNQGRPSMLKGPNHRNNCYGNLPFGFGRNGCTGMANDFSCPGPQCLPVNLEGGDGVQAYPGVPFQSYASPREVQHPSYIYQPVPNYYQEQQIIVPVTNVPLPVSLWCVHRFGRVRAMHFRLVMRDPLQRDSAERGDLIVPREMAL